MNEKNKESLQLLNQIIEEAEKKDRLHREEAIANHKASLSIGESWECFHLKKLKELLEKGE